MARERGRLRLGFLTSPAVKVTLFQASAENRDPTWATAKMVRIPTNGPAAVPLAEWGELNRQKSWKFAATACALRPTKIPAATNAASAETLAMVKIFCTVAPVLIPKTFRKLKKRIMTMPARFCVLRP